MKADYLSFKRAVSVSLIGLAFQLAMGLPLLAYGIIYRDHAAISGALLVLALSPVWLMLAIVFDQHRRERIEALENEALDETGAREASVFSEAATDLRVQHNRLLWMHRILLPSVALLLSGGLVALGVWRYLQGQYYLDPEKYVSSPSFGWPVTLGLALAFTGFVFARYVAGMAKQPVWGNLRAGAAASAAAAVVGLAIAVAQLVDFIGPNIVIRIMHVAIPLIGVVIGIEFVLNFLLNLYRPRKPGEYPRAPFDSRIMGFLAAPDRIAESIGGALNYQFGFDVTGSWFYQLISKSLFRLTLLGVGVIWLMTCVAVVQPNQQGMKLRLGAATSDTPLESGLYFKLPWPIDRIETFDASSARRVNLGVEPPKLKDKSILWTNDHGVDEVYFLVQPAPTERSQGSDTRKQTDLSLVSAEVPLIYTISDFVKFERLAGPESREKIITAIGKRETSLLIGQMTVEQALGAGRAGLGEQLRTRIQKRLDEINSGVRVNFVGVAGVHPPRETAASFEAVVQSWQKREAGLRNAEREANDRLIKVAGDVGVAKSIVAAIEKFEDHKNTKPAPDKLAEHDRRSKELELEVEALVTKAGGTAATVIQEAQAERWNRHMAARSRADAQEGRLAAYRASPDAYIAQTYFASLAELMGKTRVYIVSTDNALHVTTNLEDPENQGNIFVKPKDTGPPQ